MKITYEQLSFPTENQLDVRQDVDKIINWLLENKDHPRYCEGIEKVKVMIDENNFGLVFRVGFRLCIKYGDFQL